MMESVFRAHSGTGTSPILKIRARTVAQINGNLRTSIGFVEPDTIAGPTIKASKPLIVK